MRTLSRPMFKMGGPIKEGIMHGIREPYRGGGVALVGNPVYPKTNGREHHAVIQPKDYQDLKTIYAQNPGMIHPAMFRHLIPGKKYFKWLNRIPGTSKVKNWWLRNKPSWRTQPGVVTGGVEGAAAKYATQRMAPISKLAKIKSWVKENPYWAYGGAGVGMTSGAIPETVGAVGKTLGKVGKTVGLEVADRFVWDKIWDQDKWFADREKAKIDAEKNKTNLPSVEKVLTDAELKIIEDAKLKKAKADRDKRVNNLLEIMGYDKSKNDAVSKALIDASQIIGERGTLSKKNITRELINPIIAATGKRLEKPEQIREAVGLMMAKGEIEKQMNPLKNEALRLQIEGYKKQLAGTNFKEAVLAASKDGQPSGAKLAGLARQYLPGDFKVMQLKVPDKTDTLEFIIDEVKKSHTNPDIDPFPAGQYVLKERVIKIDEQGNVTPLDL